MLDGKLSSGLKWMCDDEGTILVYGENAAGEMEWLEPSWGSLSEEDQDELSAIGTEVNNLLDLRKQVEKVTSPFELENGKEMALSLSFIVKKNPNWLYSRKMFQNEYGVLVYREVEHFRDTFCSPSAPHYESKDIPVTIHFIAHYEKSIRRALEEDEDIRAVFGKENA